MKQVIRLAVLGIARSLGLFALARRATANDLRILCYHGAALDDEEQFHPALFISGATFERRMRHLQQAGYPVLPLDEAIQRLRDGTLPSGATAITIDDGWYGTFRIMQPILRACGFPATLYAATLVALVCLAAAASALVARRTVNRPIVDALAHV